MLFSICACAKLSAIKVFYVSVKVTDWSEWSNCSIVCKRGLQTRYRECFDGDHWFNHTSFTESALNISSKHDHDGGMSECTNVTMVDYKLCLIRDDTCWKSGYFLAPNKSCGEFCSDAS